jgi:hypothetical protein
VALYLGATRHPDLSLPSEAEAERDITSVFGAPGEADEVLRGDYLIQRFHVIDLENGKRYVGDICRGKVSAVFASMRGDWTAYSYSVLVEPRGLQPEVERIKTLVDSQAPYTASGADGYLGFFIKEGTAEVISINYNGILPDQVKEFESPEGEDLYTFLARMAGEEPALQTKLVAVDRNNYLLGSSDAYPHLPAVFKLKKAVYIAKLVLVDASSLD